MLGLKELEQLRLEFRISEAYELLPLGYRASRVFCEIAERDQVTKYAVTSYFPDGTYKHDPAQAAHWVDGNPSEKELYDWSIRLRQGLVLDFEGGSIDLRPIMGVCSIVEIADGSKHHIPMLDFGIEVKDDSLRIIRNSLSLPRGVLLKSGDSYHYYGYDLMSDENWREWMENLDRRKDSPEEVIDPNYLDFSLSRGYAALRVFRYPGTSKNTAPVVVGYV